MRIFITGGAGFIGGFVVSRLVRGNDHILFLAQKPADGKAFSKLRRLRIIYGNLAAPKKWEKKVKKFKPEACIHLAWEGIPDYGVEMSVKNLSNSLQLFRLLASVGCKKIIVSGSCFEYGATSGKITEEHKLNPQTPFAAAKISLSLLGEQIVKENEMDLVWLRFFYVYGPGRKSSSLISHLMGCKANGLIPELKNPRGGNDFVYVDDVARAVVMALHKNGLSGVYNVGSGRVFGTGEIANLIYGKRIIRALRPRGFYADISKIKKVLGWRPKIDIKTGIRKTIT